MGNQNSTTIELKENERLDELQRNGYRIIQNGKKFCFGMDAVLLSGFAKVREGETVLDIGTGTGIIPILLEAKTEGKHFTGLEIQAESADMALRSVALNGLSDKIDIITGDIKEAEQLFRAASFDVITTNPPYMIGNHGLTNSNEPKAIARHEIWYAGGCCKRGQQAVKAERKILYDSPSVPACGNFCSADKI